MFMWHKHKKGKLAKYTVGQKYMKMTTEIWNCLRNENKKFVSFCNGVGSKIGFWNKIFYHIIPDSIWFLNITGASDLHDVGYSVPKTFKSYKDAFNYWNEVNEQFRDNLIMLIESRNSWKYIKEARLLRTSNYYKLLTAAIAWWSFISDKKISGHKPTKINAMKHYKRLMERNNAV